MRELVKQLLEPDSGEPKEMRDMKPTTVPVLMALSVTCFWGCRTVAPGPVAGNTLTDGVFDGVGKSFPVEVVTRVTVRDGEIGDIELLKHRTMHGRPAEKEIPRRIIAQQSTKVDAVTGATLSSKAIMRAVQNALGKAKR